MSVIPNEDLEPLRMELEETVGFPISISGDEDDDEEKLCNDYLALGDDPFFFVEERSFVAVMKEAIQQAERSEESLKLLEDHHVVVKGKGALPTKATRVFGSDVRAEFARLKPPFQEIVDKQNVCFQTKYGGLYLDGRVPSVDFYVPVDKVLEDETLAKEWVKDPEDVRFSPKNHKVAFVRASEECVKDYVRNMRRRDSANDSESTTSCCSRKKRKSCGGISDNSSVASASSNLTTVCSYQSPSTAATGTSTSLETSLSQMTVDVPLPAAQDEDKVFQLKSLDNLRDNVQEILQDWKQSSSGYEKRIKVGLIDQFWEDLDKYDALLKDHPLESGSNLDDFQVFRQEAHQDLLIGIVNSLGNKMIDWYNQDLSKRTSAAAVASSSGGPPGPQGGSPTGDSNNGGPGGSSKGGQGGPPSGGGGGLGPSVHFERSGSYRGGFRRHSSERSLMSDITESCISGDEHTEYFSESEDSDSIISIQSGPSITSKSNCIVKPPFGPFLPRRRVKVDRTVLPSIPETELVADKSAENTTSSNTPVVVVNLFSSKGQALSSLPAADRIVTISPAGLSRARREALLYCKGGEELSNKLSSEFGSFAQGRFRDHWQDRLIVFSTSDAGVHCDTGSILSALSNQYSSTPGFGCQMMDSISSSVAVMDKEEPKTWEDTWFFPELKFQDAEEMSVATPFMSRELSMTEYMSMVQCLPFTDSGLIATDAGLDEATPRKSRRVRKPGELLERIRSLRLLPSRPRLLFRKRKNGSKTHPYENGRKPEEDQTASGVMVQ